MARPEAFTRLDSAADSVGQVMARQALRKATLDIAAYLTLRAQTMPFTEAEYAFLKKRYRS